MSSFDASLSLPPGTPLGDYLIEDVIGTGGFSIVYAASDNIGRRLAIKEYMPESLARRSEGMTVTARSERTAATFQQGLESFVKEAKTLARFNSPAIVQVYSFWQGNGTAYMAMPLYAGLTLKAELKARSAPPDEAWLRRILDSLLDVLAILHAERVWHRDIAPDNILLQGDQPVLLDFGAARRVIGEGTQNLTAILKPGYAPWEQYGEAPGLEQGPWTDLYALAAVMYWAIGGKVPPVSVSRAHADSMVPARTIGEGRYSAAFLATIDHALAVRPSERPQSVAEFRQSLGRPAMAPAAPIVDDDATRIIETPPRTRPVTQARPQVPVPRPAQTQREADDETTQPPRPTVTKAAAATEVALPPPPPPPPPPPRSAAAAPAPVPAPVPAPPTAAPVPGSGKRTPVAATLAGLAAVVVLAAGGWWMLGRPATSPATANAPAAEPTRVAEPPVAAPAPTAPTTTPEPAPAPVPAPAPAPAPQIVAPAPAIDPPAAAPVAAPRLTPPPETAPAQAKAPTPRPAPKPVVKAAGNDPRCAELLQLMSLGQDSPALRDRMAQYKCQ